MAKKIKSKRAVKPASAPDFNPISTVSLIDKYGSYPTYGLTPQKLTSILREADRGDITRLAELFQEMVTKDPDLFAPLNTRKLAVKGVGFEILAGGENEAAVKIRDYIASGIERIVKFNDSIGDLLDAVPRGLAACWIEWYVDESGDVGVRELHHVGQKNFRYGRASDPKSDLKELRRLTDTNLVDGVELEPDKWIIHEVKATSGFATQVQMLRVGVWMYLFKNFGWKAFVTFCEIYGIPLRIGKYPSGTVNDDETINKLKTALRSLGIDASGVIPDNMIIEIIEAAKSGSTDNVHVKLIELATKSYQKAFLGHTGTSESTPGKLGSEDAAKEVKFELVQADAEALQYTLTDRLIRPWVDFQFGPQDDYPYIEFMIVKPIDLKSELEVDKGLVKEIGLPLSKKYFYQKYGRPVPEDDEELVEPPVQNVLPFGSAAAKGLLGEKAGLFKG